MSTTCHACGKPVVATANRCTSCGRSLVKQGTAVHRAGPAATSPVPGGASAGEGATDFIVHGVIALITGVVSCVLIAILFRRMLFADNAGVTTGLVLILGFCIPAALAFHGSYKKSQEAKERKQHGLTRTRGFTDVAEGTSAKAYVPPTRVNVPTPHYERSTMEHLPCDCPLDDDLLAAWTAMVEPLPGNAAPLPRNVLSTALDRGDAQPAVIVHSDADIIIASAYSDEFDNYLLMGFTGRERDRLVADGRSAVGTRLVCAWTYSVINPLGQSDIVRGKNSSSNFAAGEATLVDLLTRDTKRLDLLKRKFGDKMYATVLDGSRQLLASGKVTRIRSGSPLVGSCRYLERSPATVSA